MLPNSPPSTNSTPQRVTFQRIMKISPDIFYSHTNIIRHTVYRDNYFFFFLFWVCLLIFINFWLFIRNRLSCHFRDKPTTLKFLGKIYCIWISKTLFKFFFFFYFFFKINFYWSMVALQCCVSLHCTTKWIRHTYRYPLPFGLPSHLGYHSALGRVPCAVQYVPISCLFYT